MHASKGRVPEYRTLMLPAAFRLGEPPDIPKRTCARALIVQRAIQARIEKPAPKQLSPRKTLILAMAEAGHSRGETARAAKCSRHYVDQVIRRYRPDLRNSRSSVEVAARRYLEMIQHRANGLSWAEIGMLYFRCSSRRSYAAAARTFFMEHSRKKGRSK